MNPPAPAPPGRPDGDSPAAALINEIPVASYEIARDELAAVVTRLEVGGLDLDESLTLWERGEHLAAVCSRFLDGARQRVEAALSRSEQDGD